MKVLTRAEFDWQILETTKLSHINYDFQGFDVVTRNISKWSDDSYSEAKFASGIKLSLFNDTVYCDYNYLNKHNDFQALVSKFYLSGYHGVISPGIENVAAEYIEKAGQSYIFYLPNIEEIEQFFAGTYLKQISINLDLSFLRSFVSKLDGIPQQLLPFIEREKCLISIAL